MTHEWVNGPDVLERLDFFGPGYFYIQYAVGREPRIVRVCDAQWVHEFDTMYRQSVHKYLTPEFWWAKVHFPVFDKQGK